MPSLLPLGQDEGTTVVFPLQRSPRAPLSSTLAYSRVSLQAVPLDHQHPLKYFRLKLEKNESPWRLTLYHRLKSSCISEHAVPSLLCKTSRKPRVSDHSLTGSELYPSGRRSRKRIRKREKRMKGRDADAYGGGCRQEPSASLLPQPHKHNYLYWGHTLRQ